MQRVSLRRAGERVKGGYSLSRKRITPFKSPKRKVLTLQASSSKSCDACRLHFPARGIAAFSVAIRFASAPIIRCRSAHLVEVQPNFRLPPVSTMRRAQQAAFGKQSAAEQTSLAPHDSKARLIVATTRRRFMAKPCTPHLHCAACAALQDRDRQCNLSLGGSRGIFSFEKENPPLDSRQRHRRCHPHCAVRRKQKKRAVLSHSPLLMQV